VKDSWRPDIFRLTALAALLANPFIASGQDASEKPSDRDFYNLAIDAQEAGRFEDARVHFAKSCEEESAVSCGFLGVMLQTGQGGPIDWPKARTLFGKACEGRYAKGCYNLGIMLHQGQGGAVDRPKARIFFARSCDDATGHPEGCLNLGLMHYNAEGGPANIPKAKIAFKKACTLEVQRACDIVKKLR
jgi:uncharacterized protein